MSAFNILVPIGDEQRVILSFIIQWPTEIGRLRYSWMSKDGTEGYILYKDGPDSWSENKEQVEAAIKSHPLFKSYHVSPRDSVYVIGTFDLTKVDPERKKWVDYILKSDAVVAELGLGHTSPTEDPFDIFDRELKKLSEGTLQGEKRQEVDKLTTKLKDALDSGESGVIIV